MSATLVIEGFGLSCFKITVKFDVGEVSLLTDPFSPEGSLKMPRGISADIVAVSERPTAPIADIVTGTPFVIDHPGEYEVKGIFVYGIAEGAPEKKETKRHTLYRIEAGDLRIAYLGSITHRPSDEALQELADADILFVPVGGHDAALSAADASEILTRLEPRVVIPTMYKVAGTARSLDPVEKFVKESGLAPESVEKLKIAKKDLPVEDTKVYLFSR